MPQVIKLTLADRTTRLYTHWKVGQTISVKEYWADRIGIMRLCAPGCLHAYRSLELAAFAKHIYCHNYTRALLCETPEICIDDGLKLGCMELTGLKWIKLPKPTPEQAIEWAVRCNLLAVEAGSPDHLWLIRILSGTDTHEEARDRLDLRSNFLRIKCIADARLHYHSTRAYKQHYSPTHQQECCAYSVKHVCTQPKHLWPKINSLAISILNSTKEL